MSDGLAQLRPTNLPMAGLPMTPAAPVERGDAARNRLLLLDAARRLIAERGAESVTMDDIAVEAGVGKGTLFRRFGSRSGLMLVLLDEDEQVEQNALMFGPPPLGPGAPPLERLIAYGRDRLQFVWQHRALLSDAGRDVQSRFGAAAAVHRTHVRMLLNSAGTTGNLNAQTDALLALLEADYVSHQHDDLGHSLQAQGAAWESVAHKLCGH
ncbi:TetR/AcrR family transcriptional regulator [Mycolicibacterium llatzerense]|uniref:TetR/AcrR family transcriptional regulator n=1 Tax=Mycolicibacterium llatzerense TaxID=280871 RepID=UPI000ABF461C